MFFGFPRFFVFLSLPCQVVEEKHEKSKTFSSYVFLVLVLVLEDPGCKKQKKTRNFSAFLLPLEKRKLQKKKLGLLLVFLDLGS